MPLPYRSGASTQNTPSGIAQLRKNSEQNISISEPMSIDDFIVAENMAPPAGLTASPSPELSKQGESKSIRSHSHAIPIKHRQASLPHFVPQSVPVPAHAPNAQHEFGYITRHHRKTSIDERRVSAFFGRPGYSESSRHNLHIRPALPLQYGQMGTDIAADSEASCQLLTPCLWHWG